MLFSSEITWQRIAPKASWPKLCPKTIWHSVLFKQIQAVGQWASKTCCHCITMPLQTSTYAQWRKRAESGRRDRTSVWECVCGLLCAEARIGLYINLWIFNCLSLNRELCLSNNYKPEKRLKMYLNTFK